MAKLLMGDYKISEQDGVWLLWDRLSPSDGEQEFRSLHNLLRKIERDIESVKDATDNR